MAGKAARVAVEPSGSERDTVELVEKATRLRQGYGAPSIEGKAAREAVSERGRGANFNRASHWRLSSPMFVIISRLRCMSGCCLPRRSPNSVTKAGSGGCVSRKFRVRHGRLWFCSRFNDLTIQRFSESRLRSDSSLLGQCLRLVSYATGTLPHLRLRAFHRRSSLPSLCYRIAGNSVAAL